MIDCLIQLRGLVDGMFTRSDWKGLSSLQEIKIRSLAFTYDDWELLNALRDCLDPFAKATIILSGVYSTKLLSYFVLQTLKENVQQGFSLSDYHSIIKRGSTRKPTKINRGQHMMNYYFSVGLYHLKAHEKLFLNPNF